MEKRRKRGEREDNREGGWTEGKGGRGRGKNGWRKMEGGREEQGKGGWGKGRKGQMEEGSMIDHENIEQFGSVVRIFSRMQYLE